MTAPAKELTLTPRADAAPMLTPLDLLNMAVEKKADLAQLQALMDMKERWEASESRKAFVAAMNAFKADPPELEKTKLVKFKDTKFMHATLDKVCAIVGAALSKHGLSHRWEVQQADGAIKVTCVLTHELGHSERVTMQAGADTTGSKNAIQAIGSAVTYLQRYTLLSATGLAAKDQDDDGNGASNGGLITQDQVDELAALIKETKSDTTKFLAHFGSPSLVDLPASIFPKAKRMLETKKKEAVA